MLVNRNKFPHCDYPFTILIPLGPKYSPQILPLAVNHKEIKIMHLRHLIVNHHSEVLLYIYGGGLPLSNLIDFDILN